MPESDGEEERFVVLLFEEAAAKFDGFHVAIGGLGFREHAPVKLP